MVATLDKLRTAMNIESLQYAMLCFIAGLAFNGFAVGFSYMTQNALYNESIDKLPAGRHGWPLFLAGFLFILSLIMFCAGGMVAVRGIKV